MQPKFFTARAVLATGKPIEESLFTNWTSSGDIDRVNGGDESNLAVGGLLNDAGGDIGGRNWWWCKWLSSYELESKSSDFVKV